MADGMGPTYSKQRNNKNTQGVVEKAQGKIPIWIQGRGWKSNTKVKAYSYNLGGGGGKKKVEKIPPRGPGV